MVIAWESATFGPNLSAALARPTAMLPVLCTHVKGLSLPRLEDVQLFLRG